VPKITEQLREARREAILRATLESLAERGYAGTSMRTIAEAAGLTKGGLYAYFESREAILLELAGRSMTRHLADALPREGERGMDALLRVLAAFERAPTTEVLRTQRAILDLWTLAGEVPAVRTALAERYARYLETFATLVRAGQRDGSFREEVDPEHAAGLLLASRDGILFHAIKLGLPVPVQPLTALLRESLVGWLRR
jgi:AcrR family transcriptional regulator